MRKSVLSAILLVLALSLGFSQQKIELIHSNVLTTLKKYGPDYQFLKGQVIMAHDSSTIFCDSAVYNLKRNSFFAYKTVRIVSIKGKDTVLMSCDSILYLGDSSYAYAYGHIKLEKDSVVLYTDSLQYDFKTDEAKYTGGGEIISGEKDTLISKIGIYNTKKRTAIFSENVKLLGDKYKLFTDSLLHDFRNKLSYFYGPTTIKTDSNTIFALKGIYDQKTKTATIAGKSKITLKKQIITADSISYNRQTGVGQAWRNVIIVDTSENFTLIGNYGKFWRNSERLLMSQKATLMQYDNNDTVWLTADTLISFKDTLYDQADTFIYRKALAYHHVKSYNKHLQLKCDSLVYSFLDSTIYLYGSPVIWSDSLQLYGDFAELTTVKGDPYQLIIKNKVYIAEHTYDDNYNQIYGNDVTINFRNRQIYRVDVMGDAKAIYFIYQDSVLIAINNLQCDTIKIFLKNKKVRGLKAMGKPQGRIIPPAQASEKDKFLPGFQWYSEYRPLKPEDIYQWKRE